MKEFMEMEEMTVIDDLIVPDLLPSSEVEMQSQAMKGDSQLIDHINIKNRAIYYLCNLHSGQPGRGVSYDKLLRSFQVTFCCYTVFPEYEDFINRFSFRNEKAAELSGAVGIIFIELQKLSGIIKKPVEDMTSEEQWSLFFAYGGDLKHIELINRLCEIRSEIKMAKELLSTISRDERERALFRSRRLLQMDIDHDRAITRNERSVEIAKNLLETVLSMEKIAQVTGLTVNEVEALRIKH